MTPEMLFEYFAVRLDGPNAAGKKIALNVNFTDLKKQYSLVVENAVLNYSQKPVDKADARITFQSGAGCNTAQGEDGRAGNQLGEIEDRGPGRTRSRNSWDCWIRFRSGSTS